MPIFNKYHYKRLCAEDAVRLIALDPATSEEDPLSCSIIQYRRSEQILDYSAISYTWGDRVFSRNLEIQCDDDVSYVRITHNVETLLRRLRALGSPHYLWIDAICLNQADESEKAQQVPVMGRIFGEAKVVHIWLGPEDRTTAKLFAFFREVGLLPEIEKNEMSGLVANLMKKIFGGPDSLRALAAMVNFSERPWFSRRWIIQEACLARKATVHCGTYSTPLPLLVLAATRFQTLDMSSYPIKVMANLCTPTTKFTILELLWNFHEARCLKRKDRIAALFGLIPDCHRFDLDYASHWTELYKQAVTGIFALGNNDTRLQVLLHLFEFGPVSLSGDIAYPSWVPDWSNSRRRRLPYYSDIRNPDTYEPYPTSLGNSAKAGLTFHHDTLRIHWHASISGSRGRQVIYVTKLDPPPQNEAQSTERVKNVLHKLFPPTSDSALRILAVSSFLKMIVTFRHSSRDQKLNKSVDKHFRKNSKRLPESLKALGSLLQEFCLFELESPEPKSKTSAGYGISSQQIQVGDVMIPLWNINDISGQNIDIQNSLLSQRKAAIHMNTMLVVRCIKKRSLSDATGMPNEESLVETGRIVGPAVCVLLEGEQSHEDGLSDAKWDDHLREKQQYSMQLI
ncbi:HET-domain-containing protein [Xylaria digitata]|nr:HET-domain-containing protein [Xylaria digitata]